MRQLAAVAALGMMAALSACGGETENADDTTVVETETAGGMSAGAGGAGAGAGVTADWPEGSRIVEEGGTTYRVDAAGARVALQPGSSRIVVEDGMRYRVDPDGARFRIDEQGALVIGDSVITGNAPNGASDVETPGEAVTDAAEDAVEAVGDVVD